MKPTITAREHYDRLAESGHWSNDPPFMEQYMARWDGPPFWNALGDLSVKDVLEVGIGCGRIARQVLKRGCRSLTGLDISSKTVAATATDLAEFSNIEIINDDITDFTRSNSFDLAISVLTFMHVQDKQRALQNIVDSLRPSGRVVLSVDNSSDVLDYGDWIVRLHPWLPESYAGFLAGIGCDVEDPISLIDKWIDPEGKKSATYGKEVASLIRATRR